MLFNYAEKNTPFTLSPESLDWHLARGWYRMGSNIFTTHFLFFRDRPFSAVWVRLDLQDFSFSKHQRKLLRKNAKVFKTSVGPRLIDTEREELFDRYAQAFDGRLSPSIADSLEDYDDQLVFNTWETTIRERTSDTLVACSYFDLGEDSCASILGIFDPRLKAFSLGYYTMLLEIQHCLEVGIRYYYPGYVVPGYRRFDYKLRIGNCDYYDVRTDGWLPISELDASTEGPVEVQQRALAAFVAAYNARAHQVKLLVYPLFEASLYDIWNDDYLPYPYCVPILEISEEELIVVAYDPKERNYFILLCRYMSQTQLFFNTSFLSGFEGDDYLTELVAVRKILVKTPNLSIAVEICSGLDEIKL